MKKNRIPSIFYLILTISSLIVGLGFNYSDASAEKAITVLGTGDLLIDREKPESIFSHVKDTLQSADITFGNSEQTYAEGGRLIRGYGTNSEERMLPAVQSAGFDVISLCNNHSLDWGEEVLLKTMDSMRKSGIEYVGVGKTIDEAREPVIINRNGTKVGFLAYSSVHHKGYEATEKSPGLVPIRAWTIYEQTDYQPGTPPRIVTIPYLDDLERMKEDIRKLKKKVDAVVVSMHWGVHIVPRIIPMYCFTIGHAAIDAGADIIIGHHPHICKGIEMYKGKAIFYSVGNFAAEIGPSQRENFSGGLAHKLVKDYGVVPDPDCPKCNSSREARVTMIVKMIIENGVIKRLAYIPCFVNKDVAPEIVTQDSSLGQEVFHYIQDISRSENLQVRFQWDNDEVLVLP